MTATLEREIKLPFPTPASARTAILAAGGQPNQPRRLQQDFLLDTPDGFLRSRQSALRVRLEAGRSQITFKGPVQPSRMKLREELETSLGDGPLTLEILTRIGFVVWFRAEKYREEFSVGDLVVALDETPVGTFVELEGAEAAIVTFARALGFPPERFLLDSYRGLFVRHCQERGLIRNDMLFGAD